MRSKSESTPNSSLFCFRVSRGARSLLSCLSPPPSFRPVPFQRVVPLCPQQFNKRLRLYSHPLPERPSRPAHTLGPLYLAIPIQTSRWCHLPAGQDGQVRFFPALDGRVRDGKTADGRFRVQSLGGAARCPVSDCVGAAAPGEHRRGDCGRCADQYARQQAQVRRKDAACGDLWLTCPVGWRCITRASTETCRSRWR